VMNGTRAIERVRSATITAIGGRGCDVPRGSTRTAAALLLTVAATLIAAPVGAVEVLDTSGDPGTYTIRDTVSRPSVRCRFEDAVAHLDEQLDRVSALPLKVRVIRAIRTWVGYRFSVLQRPALEPDYAFVHK